MKKDHAVFIHSSLVEAKDYAKAVLRYLYEVEKKSINRGGNGTLE